MIEVLAVSAAVLVPLFAVCYFAWQWAAHGSLPWWLKHAHGGRVLPHNRADRIPVILSDGLVECGCGWSAEGTEDEKWRAYWRHASGGECTYDQDRIDS